MLEEHLTHAFGFFASLPAYLFRQTTTHSQAKQTIAEAPVESKTLPRSCVIKCLRRCKPVWTVRNHNIAASDDLIFCFCVRKISFSSFFVHKKNDLLWLQLHNVRISNKFNQISKSKTKNKALPLYKISCMKIMQVIDYLILLRCEKLLNERA